MLIFSLFMIRRFRCLRCHWFLPLMIAIFSFADTLAYAAMLPLLPWLIFIYFLRLFSAAFILLPLMPLRRCYFHWCCWYIFAIALLPYYFFFIVIFFFRQPLRYFSHASPLLPCCLFCLMSWCCYYFHFDAFAMLSFQRHFRRFSPFSSDAIIFHCHYCRCCCLCRLFLSDITFLWCDCFIFLPWFSTMMLFIDLFSDIFLYLLMLRHWSLLRFISLSLILMLALPLLIAIMPFPAIDMLLWMLRRCCCQRVYFRHAYADALFLMPLRCRWWCLTSFMMIAAIFDIFIFAIILIDVLRLSFSFASPIFSTLLFAITLLHFDFPMMPPPRHCFDIAISSLFFFFFFFLFWCRHHLMLLYFIFRFSPFAMLSLICSMIESILRAALRAFIDADAAHCFYAMPCCLLIASDDFYFHLLFHFLFIDAFAASFLSPFSDAAFIYFVFVIADALFLIDMLFISPSFAFVSPMAFFFIGFRRWYAIYDIFFRCHAPLIDWLIYCLPCCRLLHYASLLFFFRHWVRLLPFADVYAFRHAFIIFAFFCFCWWLSPSLHAMLLLMPLMKYFHCHAAAFDATCLHFADFHEYCWLLYYAAIFRYFAFLPWWFASLSLLRHCALSVFHIDFIFATPFLWFARRCFLMPLPLMPLPLRDTFLICAACRRFACHFSFAYAIVDDAATPLSLLTIISLFIYLPLSIFLFFCWLFSMPFYYFRFWFRRLPYFAYFLIICRCLILFSTPPLCWCLSIMPPLLSFSDYFVYFLFRLIFAFTPSSLHFFFAAAAYFLFAILFDEFSPCWCCAMLLSPLPRISVAIPRYAIYADVYTILRHVSYCHHIISPCWLATMPAAVIRYRSAIDCRYYAFALRCYVIAITTCHCHIAGWCYFDTFRMIAPHWRLQRLMPASCRAIRLRRHCWLIAIVIYFLCCFDITMLFLLMLTLLFAWLFSSFIFRHYFDTLCWFRLFRYMSCHEYCCFAADAYLLPLLIRWYWCWCRYAIFIDAFISLMLFFDYFLWLFRLCCCHAIDDFAADAWFSSLFSLISYFAAFFVIALFWYDDFHFRFLLISAAFIILIWFSL